MTRLNAANNAQTTLTASIAASDTSFYVNNGSVFPSAPFLATIGDEATGLEIILVGAIAGDLLSSITRAQEGTTARAYDAETAIENRFTAGMYNDLLYKGDIPKCNYAATADPTENDDSGDGYGIGSIWVNTTTPKAFTCVDATAGAAVWSSGGGGSDVLNKYDAIAAPTANDDSEDGYSVGSRWIDVTNDVAYTCLDASAGAAIWNKISGLTAHTGALITSETVHGLKIESGSWTPVVAGSTTPGTNTYATQTGTYYKIGHLVIAKFSIGMSAKDAAMAGNATYIGGLPFACNGEYAPSFTRPSGITLDAGYYFLGGYSSGNNIYLLQRNASWNNVPVANVAANTSLLGVLVYTTNS